MDLRNIYIVTNTVEEKRLASEFLSKALKCTNNTSDDMFYPIVYFSSHFHTVMGRTDPYNNISPREIVQFNDLFSNEVE